MHDFLGESNTSHNERGELNRRDAFGATLRHDSSNFPVNNRSGFTNIFNDGDGQSTTSGRSADDNRSDAPVDRLIGNNSY